MADEPNLNPALDNPTPAPNPAPAAAAVDYNAVYATLKPENKEIFERKGYHRAGANGGPADVNMLLDTIRHQDGLIGKNNLPQPNTADAKELSSWAGWKALGVPESADGYKINRAEMPVGADGQPIAYDEKMEKVLLGAMQAGRVPQAYAQNVYDALVSARVAEAQALHQEIAQDRIDTDAALTKSWGANKDKMVAQAQNALRQLAGKIGVDPNTLAQDSNAVLGSAGVVKLFAFLAQNMGEDIIVPSDGRPGDISTPEGARATIAAKEADPEFMRALRDPASPGHQQAVELRRKLYGVAHST